MSNNDEEPTVRLPRIEPDEEPPALPPIWSGNTRTDAEAQQPLRQPYRTGDGINWTIFWFAMFVVIALGLGLFVTFANLRTRFTAEVGVILAITLTAGIYLQLRNVENRDELRRHARNSVIALLTTAAIVAAIVAFHSVR